MKKTFILLSTLMLLAACDGNINSSSSGSNAISSSATTSTESINSSTSTSSSATTSSESVETAPDLAAAISALGEKFVIRYTNSQKSADSMLYFTGKSVFIQNDSTMTELTDYEFEWWVETTREPGILDQCSFEASEWFWYGESQTYGNVASNANTLNASLFKYESSTSTFVYLGDYANALTTFEMLVGLNKKNDFVNLDFSKVEIKLSDDNSIIDTISISGNDKYGDKEAVTINLKFSAFTQLPFGLSDEKPIESV